MKMLFPQIFGRFYPQKQWAEWFKFFGSSHFHVFSYKKWILSGYTIFSKFSPFEIYLTTSTPRSESLNLTYSIWIKTALICRSVAEEGEMPIFNKNFIRHELRNVSKFFVVIFINKINK